MAGGVFIVLDGPDGSGKSTQTARLRDHLADLGRTVVHLRDPGGTRVGEKVRDILLDRAHIELTPMTECLLFMASRAQLVRERINPALENGLVVLCERWVTSTVCYQGYAGGLSPEAIWELADIATGGTRPDLTLILDVQARKGIDRISGEPDLMESRSLDFHERVRRGFHEIAAEGRSDTRLLAPGTRDEVFKAIVEAVDEVLR